MADPTKRGFLQTVPGMMTATTGILSATAGLLVALNQTGVVDLRQLAGSKPAAQSSPVETPSSAVHTVDNPSMAKRDTDKSVIEAKKQEEIPTSPSRVQDDPAQPAPGAADREVETKKQGPIAPSLTPPTPLSVSRNPAPETEKRVVETTKQQDPPPAVRPVQDKPTWPKPIPERVTKAKNPQESPPVSATRPDDATKPGADTDRKTVPTNRREERAPFIARSQNDATQPRPETQVRLADARKQEPMPTAAQPTEHDAKKPKLLRSDPEEPRAVGKAKAISPEPTEKKHSEPDNAGKKDKRQDAPAEAKQPEKAPGSSASPPTKDAVPTKAASLKLTGLVFTVPGGWIKEDLAPSPMGPVAVFKIPKLDAAGEDGVVRITHFPNMKGKDKDEMNIDRWLGQVSKPDGKPLTRTDAKITTTEVGPVRLTVVDMSGTAKLTMRDSAKPNQRMIAAIVDHPQGPHFVVTAGPAASMEKWAAQIDAFLKSAKPE